MNIDCEKGDVVVGVTHLLKITGFCGSETENHYLGMYADKVRNWDDYDVDAVKRDIFDKAEDAFNNGDLNFTYEIKGWETRSGNMDSLWFDRSDFAMKGIAID